jgi:hypothetical protein
MSFLDKFKHKGPRDADIPDADIGSIFDEVAPIAAGDAVLLQPSMKSVATAAPRRVDLSAPTQPPTRAGETSIMSEVLPSETAAEFEIGRASCRERV